MLKATARNYLFTGLMITALFGACSKNSNPLSPFEPEIVNITDSFEFQATGLENITTVQNYFWQNTGAAATINHSSAVSQGSATITVYDANGAEVYTSALLASATDETSTGIPGTWNIRVTLANAGGTLNFRLEKL